MGLLSIIKPGSLVLGIATLFSILFLFVRMRAPFKESSDGFPRELRLGRPRDHLHVFGLSEGIQTTPGCRRLSAKPPPLTCPCFDCAFCGVECAQIMVLTQAEDVSLAMSDEMRDMFYIPISFVSTTMLICIFVTLVLATIQLGLGSADPPGTQEAARAARDRETGAIRVEGLVTRKRL